MISRSRIVILLLIASFSCLAQKENERQPDLGKYEPYFISLPLPEKKSNPGFPVSAIEVYDARFDTSGVGLIQKPADARAKLICMKRGTGWQIKEFYTSLIGPAISRRDTSISLVCFIKKLFLSDKIYVDNNSRVSPRDPVFEIKSGVMATFEFYAKRDKDFLPLYRFDSMATGDKPVFNNGQNYVAAILMASLRKLEILDPDKVRKYNKPKRVLEIDSFNYARFDIPILREALRKGIYINFENFKNNSPVDSPFTVDKGTRGDFLYVKNKEGEDILQTEICGYSDGKNGYIYSAEHYYKLIRHSNTFIIYGAKDFTNVRKLRLNFSLLDVAIPNSNYSKARTVSSYRIIPSFYMLDMESGELY